MDLCTINDIKALLSRVEFLEGQLDQIYAQQSEQQQRTQEEQ